MEFLLTELEINFKNPPSFRQHLYAKKSLWLRINMFPEIFYLSSNLFISPLERILIAKLRVISR